jgi:6-phosphogluconolactonase
MMLTFYMGSYTEYPIPEFGGIGKGIYTVQLDTVTGALNLVHSIMERNPSYLAVDSNSNYIFCATEIEEDKDPKVKSFKIKKDFSLELIDEQRIIGGFPCHILAHKDHVMVACYATGNIIHLLTDDHVGIRKVVNNFYHHGKSINRERQEGPHAHQTTIHPNGKDIYVCDLGIDTIKAYSFEEGMVLPNQKNDCVVTRGGGPRHMVFNKEGTIAYVINELTANIGVLQYAQGKLKEVAVYSSLPDDFMDKPSASAIRMHPNGKFLYVGNRGLEAITVFKVNGSELEVVHIQYTYGEELREFNLTPDGLWLIACHQNSHDTVVYQTIDTGELVERYRTKDIKSPSCIVFPN